MRGMGLSSHDVCLSHLHSSIDIYTHDHICIQFNKRCACAPEYANTPMNALESNHAMHVHARHQYSGSMPSYARADTSQHQYTTQAC